MDKSSCQLKGLVRSELSGWTLSEVTWLLFCCVLVIGLSWPFDTWIGIMSAATGVINVILNGKGKLSTYAFGLINIILYTYISIENKFYGTALLYSLYFFPMNIYGFFAWKRHLNPETFEVEKRRVTAKWRWFIVGSVVCLTCAGGIILQRLQGNLPFLDAFITSLSVAAMAASVKRCLEQWVLWLIADAATVCMWGVEYSCGGANLATLLMWIVFLINGVIMYFRWAAEIRKQETTAAAAAIL